MKKFLILNLIFLITSCTWTPRNILPTYLRTIYVPVAENKTLTPDIEKLLTEKVKTEFQLDSRLTVTEYVSLAHGILYIQILKYKLVPVTYTSSGEIDTTSLIIGVRIELKDIKSTETLIEGEIEEKTDYNLKSEPIETETEARERVLANLAKRIVSKSIEGW